MKLAVRVWEPSAPPPPPDWLDEAGDTPLVWLAALPATDELLPQLAADLSPEERARASAYRHAEDRRRSVLARALARRLLAPGLGLPPAALDLATSSAGKPFLRTPHGAPPAPRFNLSHSGELVLFAAHPLFEVGVDVERVRDDFDPADLAATIFEPAQHTAWLALPAPERTGEFFRAWTRHEATLKALGSGFSGRPRDEGAGPGPGTKIADLLLPDARHVGACAWFAKAAGGPP